MYGLITQFVSGPPEHVDLVLQEVTCDENISIGHLSVVTGAAAFLFFC